MMIFNDKPLTDEQRARYDWAVAEYARIQEENRLRLEHAGRIAVPHRIGPQSALFARLLEGKDPLPSPPPVSYGHPWYDIIELSGPHHVSIGRGLKTEASSDWEGCSATDEHVILNQCAWKVIRKNQAAVEFLAFLQHYDETAKTVVSSNSAGSKNTGANNVLQEVLARKPELIVSYATWGEFRLSLGRIIRRGRRDAVVNSAFDMNTLDGGNAVIVKVLRSGADIRAKSDATIAAVRSKFILPNPDITPFDQITLAAERSIPRSNNHEDDDLVEFDCDGWVLEKLA